MATVYKHYIQKYPQGTNTYSKIDVEATFACKYKQFKDFAFSGDISNIYSEEFSEVSGLRMFIPDEKDLAYKSYECKLQLLFDKKTAQSDAQRFYEYVRGQKVEYSDTFRNKYITIILIKQPQIQSEILYGERPYMLVEFTFTNILGCAFTKSQIK